jgi:GntR family transcriptional regulator
MAAAQLPPVQSHAGHPVLEAYRILLEAVQTGIFPANTRLPGERVLAQQLGVSRATVRQVLTTMARTGLLQASANRGWFVATVSLSEGPNTLVSFTDSARERGLTPYAQILRQQVRPATLDEAEVLGLAPVAAVLEVERLRGMNGIPVGVEYSCLPLTKLPGLDTTDLTDCSLFGVLTERYDLAPTRCDCEVQAQAASQRHADLLGVEPGFPLLVAYQTTYDQHERPLLSGHTTYRGDAYRFKASLFRF